MLKNCITIIIVVTIFRGWILYQLQQQAWKSGGLSQKTLLILNAFTMACALASSVVLAGTEGKHRILIGMFCLMVFWFLSLFVPKIIRAMKK